MCGRYTLTQIPDLEKIIHPEQAEVLISPRYNIAPTNDCPVIPQEDPHHIHLYRWGLIPHWAKSKSIGYKMINARAETIERKPAFKHGIQKRRCLVLADGFYEWKKKGKAKQPYRIHLTTQDIFSFAGISSIWYDENGIKIESFTIITTEPNDLMEDIHNRMPVILSKEIELDWLDPDLSQEDRKSLMRPFPAQQMKAYPVKPAVGNVRNDDPTLILPFDEPDLFSI